jgi:hypothetical protein
MCGLKDDIMTFMSKMWTDIKKTKDVEGEASGGAPRDSAPTNPVAPAPSNSDRKCNSLRALSFDDVKTTGKTSVRMVVLHRLLSMFVQSLRSVFYISA